MALENGVLGNHSHIVTATGNKEMSTFVVCGDWSLGFHQGTILVSALGHHATQEGIIIILKVFHGKVGE